MSDTSVSTTVGNSPAAAAVAPERSSFKRLLLGNPNYFGTLPEFGGNVILPKKFDTAFEELTCLGLDPQQNKLEAVLQIKQHSGYGTDACGAGSKEYIRFFVQHGATWQDLGLAIVDVYDLASSPLPLSYSASVDFAEARKFCSTENILNVRAILSWNLDPTPGNPNFTPPWGNVIDARVQVAPLFLPIVSIATLISEGLLKVDPSALSAIDATKTMPAAAPPSPLPYEALKDLYAKSDVPGHRFGFAAAQGLLAHPIMDFKAATKTLNTGSELEAILAALEKQSGDTSFEQLLCAGFNPQTRELEAVVQIKKNAGYSGSLCTAGSTEYVSFFAFTGGVWQSLGATSVKVHDLASVAAGKPVNYAVYRLSNLVAMPCEKLTGVPLRAILSWQQQPTGPNFVPVWGNVINTNVQPLIEAGTDENLRLMSIGGVTIDRISDISHLAYPRSPVDPSHGLPVIAGDCGGDDSPFGGELIVEGDFNPKPDVFDHVTGMLVSGGKPIIYQVWYTRTDIPGAPSQMTNTFNIALFPPLAFFPVTFPQKAVPALGPVLGGSALDTYYQYMESDGQAVNPRTLAAFESGGLDEGDYQIEVRPFSWNGSEYVHLASQFKTVHVYNGFKHTEIVGGLPTTVRSPQLSLGLTSVVDCADVTVNATITGHYSVTDEFFSNLSIALVPITIGGNPAPENAVVVIPDPGNSTTYDGTNTTGSTGTFTLDTTGMKPCGYTIQLAAYDRAIVDSHCFDHSNEIGVGFCLRAN